MSRYRAAQTPTWAGSHAHDIIHYIQLSISIVVDLWLIIFEYVLIDGYIMWHTYYIRVMPNMVWFSGLILRQTHILLMDQ